MKPLFLFVVALATTVITLFSSFSPAAEENTIKSEPACIVAAKASASMTAFFDAHYYWFLPGDVYDGFNSMFEEIVRMQNLYGVPCDGNISGGTLVARGYILPVVPHLIGPFAFVYAHF
ncbi:MAG: hypothetical protein JST68_07300 [Bacteroidetes bacterium]|nr:hypothetical protein [Bacteroidota bacterium]